MQPYDLCVLDRHVGGEFALFGVGGILMIGFHCIGMCGPLIMAFRFGSEGPRWQRVLHAGSQLLSYQGGRLLVYLAAGALVGSMGYALQGQLKFIANFLALATAAVFLLVGLGKLSLLGKRLAFDNSSNPSWLNGAMRSVLDRWRHQPYTRAFCLGIIMGFLLHVGVLVPRPRRQLSHPGRSSADGTFGVNDHAGSLARGHRTHAHLPLAGFLRDRVSPYAILFSALWLMLIGLAANGIIAHQHLTFGQWTIMFW